VEKRVLGIYHFQENAGYLGDMIDYYAILNVLRVEQGLSKVDLCYIDDPSNSNQPVSRKRLETIPGYKETMIELRALLPHQGAIFQFDSDIAFETFFHSHYKRYVTWPKYSRYHSWPSRIDYKEIPDNGFPYANTYFPLNRFFKNHGALPTISCPERLLAWAREFVNRQVFPAAPVTAQIRFNSDSPARNTDIGAWADFFRRMESREDIKFILISRREEIVPELRALKNVIYSKDHASGVLQDLALLQVSRLSMFSDAGFCTYPWFAGLPTILFGKQEHEFPRRRTQAHTGEGMRFVSSLQRRIFGEYSAHTLESEFWSLWNELDRMKWRHPYWPAEAVALADATAV
jgi:hypothetical protein